MDVMSLLLKLKNELYPPQNINVEAELVHLLYSQAGPPIVASLILATCVVFVLNSAVPTHLLYSWYALVLSVGILRYAMILVYLKINPPLEKYYEWKKLFIVIIVFAGCTWGLVGTMLIPADNLRQAFITCIFAGVTGSAVPFFAGSRLVSAVYIIPILFPFSFWLLWQPDTVHRLMGIFILSYIPLLIFSSFRVYRAVYNAIYLKFENDELLQNLSAAKKDMEIINHELQGEINDRKSAEKLLRDSEEQYRLVTDALPVLISYIDTNLNYRFNNKAHEIWFGKPLSDITFKPIKEVLGSTAYAIFTEYYEKLPAKKQITYETVMQFRDEEERYVSITLIPHMKDGSMRGLFSLISDMTPRINYLATHDALTDLPNRSLFNARFSQALKRAHRKNYKVALLFLDLDHFKNINDTLGHDIGDHLLIKVAKRVKNCLRDLDTLARLGGDEFTIILEDVTPESIVFVANKICQSFAAAFQLEGRDVFITTSIGISIYPDDATDMQILMKNADMAIYRAKEHGRNTFEFYTHELNEKINKKLMIETNLRTALEKQELLLYYQPVIDVMTQKICSLEALIRWQHPEMGLISPIEFIPVAEEVGLIVPMGEWIIRTACHQNLKWIKSGALTSGMRTSINISARQFKENNLVELITSILKETGLDGQYITLELTESLIMQDIDHSARIINALKNEGIAISIDDFGTGYSSLNYLRKFPIDILKIDRSFVTELAQNKGDASIVRAIIAMAHSLKMKVIAEGVETIEQYNFLRDNNCDEIQGYLISKPLPVMQATEFLQAPLLLPI